MPETRLLETIDKLAGLGHDGDRQQQLAGSWQTGPQTGFSASTAPLQPSLRKTIMPTIHPPRRKRPRRTTTKITVGAKQITVKAHSMSSDWVTGLGAGIIAALLGAFVFGNTIMALSGIIMIAGCSLWYFISRKHWERTVLQPAIARAQRPVARKPRTRKATP